MTRAICLAALLLILPVRVFAAAAIVQSTLNQMYSGGTVADTISFPGNVTTGNAVIVAAYISSTSLTFAVSDATNGAYDSVVTATFGLGAIRAKRNVTGGFSTVDFTISGTGSGAVISIFEVSGLDNATGPQTGTRDDGTGAVTSHVSSSTALTATGFAVAAGALNGTGGGTITAGSNWTLDSGSSGVEEVLMHGIFAWVSNQGPFTTSNALSQWMCMAIFAEAAGGGGGGGTTGGMTLRGAGK